MNSKIVIWMVFLIYILFSASLNCQPKDSLKFVPDTSYSGGIPYLGNNVTQQQPLAEIGPYIKPKEKKRDPNVYLVCSGIVLMLGAALYFFRNKRKDKRLS